MNPSEYAAVSAAYRKACFMTEKARTRGKGGGCCRAQRPSPSPRNLNVKDTGFVDTTM